MNSEKVLLVIDMQTDFVTGTLANMEAQAITEGIAGRIRECKEDGKKVLFTRDTTVMIISIRRRAGCCL